MKEYLICVDSDGCAMDTMTIKHVRCFGPDIVEIFGLEEWTKPILTRWNDINLYTRKRGINRFQGLVQMLTEVDETYLKIPGLEILADWVNHTTAYSEANLKIAIEATKENEILRKALTWSQKVNININKIPDEEKIEFTGVKEALEKIKTVADLAIVSSANREAMEEEWVGCSLMQYVDCAMAQDAGTKADCIRKMIEKGYDKSNIVMIGDALGDYRAAQDAEVSFYPILAGKEEQSWKRFSNQVLAEIISKKYTKERQKEELDLFYGNLKED
ncbi:phosphoglycolate phosphatase-like HAD superfamily hydrolase [Lachnospiraceae bacterium PM6-15]|uniref:HAD family hydrolase n=1 Tax=Ohessyouella blattaphilus TaxID=2949333 RepID=UPI003E222E02